jgi:hypothetical protein
MHTRTALSLLSLVALLGGAGCAAEATNDAELRQATESELGQEGQALVGTYASDTGPFLHLELTSRAVGQSSEFIAEMRTGIVCVMAPCPTTENVVGTFTAGSRTIAFRSTTASDHVQHLLGRYAYTVRGETLSLSRDEVTHTLDKVTEAPSCTSSSVCRSDEHCSTEDGDCESTGMLAVCTGRCRK